MGYFTQKTDYLLMFSNFHLPRSTCCCVKENFVKTRMRMLTKWVKEKIFYNDTNYNLKRGMVKSRKEAWGRKRTGSNKKQLSTEIRALYEMLTLTYVLYNIQKNMYTCIYVCCFKWTKCTRKALSYVIQIVRLGVFGL